MSDFVRLVESNDHEGETWTWWLQLDGNKAQFDKLAVLLRDCETASPYVDDFPYGLHLDDVEPETVVDMLVRHATDGYFSSHNKVVGSFTCPDDLGEQAEFLYKGGIRDRFTPAVGGSETSGDNR